MRCNIPLYLFKKVNKIYGYYGNFIKQISIDIFLNLKEIQLQVMHQKNAACLRSNLLSVNKKIITN